MTSPASRRRQVRLAALLAAALIFAASVSAAAADTHPFGIDDLAALRSARAVAVSPDGKSVLFVVGFQGEKGPARREWHLIATSGENDRKLDLPEPFTPAGFMPDGLALFGMYRIDKEPHLGIVPLTGGGPTRTIALPGGIDGAALSPDGTRFVFVSDPRPADPLAGVRTVGANEVHHLYVVGTDGSGGSWWCPELVDIADYAWSPDGSRIAVVTQLQKIGHHDVTATISVCGADGVRKVASIDNAVSGIAWTNGATELAFASSTTDVLTPDHLWTVPAAGRTPIDRTPGLAGSVTGLSNDPRGTVWVEMHKGTIIEVDAWRDGKLTPAYRWPGGIVAGPPVVSPLRGAPGAMAFTVGDPTHAMNVAVARDSGLRKITHEGDDTLAGVTLGDMRIVSWTAKDGTRLEGLLTLPAGYESGKRYPFLVLPHGGPEANDTLEFDFFSRLIAGFGYVVLQPEYRGSTGYGSEFLQAIYQHFGDRAYSDVDSATDFAVAQGWADPNRLAIFGWSAGGFMTSWTVTQTHRYKAAIEGAGITDWLSFIPTSDIAQVDYDRRFPEKDAAPFLRFSAVMYADQVTTPLLILHGEADERVPMLQGRELFVVLAERGKTVRMVTYPGSPHFPTLAEQRRNVFEEIRDWLEKYNR
jgi:dipeptidyl aminopeptidase/acylaminoacyl peptidase